MADEEGWERFLTQARTGMARELKHVRAGKPYRYQTRESEFGEYKATGELQKRPLIQPIKGSPASEGIAKVSRALRRGSEQNLRGTLEVNRNVRIQQIKDITTGLSKAGGKMVTRGLRAVAPLTTALEYREFQAGVKQGQARREKETPTGATFAGKPYKRRGKP